MTKPDGPVFIDSCVWWRALYFPATRKATEYLQSHVEEAFSLSAAAGVACMERTAFSKSFRRRTGVTFRDFAQAYRISRAVEIMKIADKPISEIAFDVGFGSIATFERVFKKITGETPSRCRNRIVHLTCHGSDFGRLRPRSPRGARGPTEL